MGKSIKERAEFLDKKSMEVRCNILDMIHTASSGHPGGSLSAADIMTALHFDLCNTRPEEPRWADRDRIVLSKGHACPVIYACLAMRGYFDMEELKHLREFEHMLQGHPIHKTPGIEQTTGSLGHGLSVGLGMALEGKMTGKYFYTYVILGDGEINEGQVWEAAMAGSKFKCDNLVAIVDRNNLQMDGTSDEVMPLGDIAAKWRAFGWETFEMDGHDMIDILTTIEKAKTVKDKPIAIVADTVKGKGVSYMENVCGWHGKCPSDDEYTCALEEIRGDA
ncbi:transketolase [Pseudodesulfovibrio sp.]|nr:transketolase [Pseudodesulfovibrio sp.]